MGPRNGAGVRQDSSGCYTAVTWPPYAPAMTRTQQTGTVGAMGGDGLRARQPGAVRHAVAVLEEVARCGPGVPGTEVARNLGLPKATTYRLLALLVELDYLAHAPDRPGFALGSRVARLAGRLPVG